MAVFVTELLLLIRDLYLAFNFPAAHSVIILQLSQITHIKIVQTLGQVQLAMGTTEIRPHRNPSREKEWNINNLNKNWLVFKRSFEVVLTALHLCMSQ